MQHDWKHVERPGESHTALDGEKKTCSYPQKSSRMRGFNWDSPRQRHRFCYVNQNKQIEKNIHKIFKQIQNNKKNKIPTDLTCTDCVHEIRRIFFLQMLQREQWSNRSLPHNLRYQDPKFFGSEIRRKIVFSLEQFVPSWSVGFLFRSTFCFFLLIYFKWNPKDFFFRSSVFKSAQLRSDGFLTP